MTSDPDTERLTPNTEPRVLAIPDFALVALVGASGSGKSTFAREHFRPTEALSSDAFRGWVSDDENALDATTDAFDALHYLAGIRLRRRKLVVVDATNVQQSARKPLLELAATHDALPVAIVLNVSERICQDRNRERPDREFGPHVVRNQSRDLRQSLRNLKREGFRYVHVLDGPEEIARVRIERTPLWTDRRTEHGPFDLIGDVHGCVEELVELLGRLGYVRPAPDAPFAHPEGRRAVFLGDLVDRGPGVVEAARLVMAMVAADSALCVPGNHDIKLMRWLQGKNVQVTHGLGDSIAQIERLPEEERAAFKRDFAEFADRLVSHYWLDEGRLVAAHAGMKEAYQGRASRRVRDFAIWGDTTGETDEFGLPVRYPWAEEYRGKAVVVYGHTPVPGAAWLNNTINIDTGCVFGGKLTALRYPERELVSVPAREVYAEPAKPFLPEVHPDPGSPEAILDDAVREMKENQIRNRERAVTAITSKNQLHMMVANEERALAELTARMGVAETQDNPAMVERLRRERDMRQEALTQLRDSLTAAEQTCEAIKTALRAEDERIRDKVAEALWRRTDAQAKALLSAVVAPAGDLLDAADVLGKRIVETRLAGNVTVQAENAAAAFEVMSRFAVEPRWLIYLPPTMSPSETSREPGYLEYPREAFGYYRTQGVPRVVCQTKHMGSRAVVVVCRDEEAAARRFGAAGRIGVCYTRTGRAFFDDAALERAFLEQVAGAIGGAGLWEELATDWLCLDCELMPWNAKAQGLLREQYAPVGAAARLGLAQAEAAVRRAEGRGLALGEVVASLERRRADAERFVEAYGRYCWPVTRLEDYRLAPFHLLASEGNTYFDRDHVWHAETLARLADHSPLLMKTDWRAVDLLDDASQQAAAEWWTAYTEAGGEGMVVKPESFVARGPRGLAQPAVKVRGREYLRIIYGPDYTEPENLERLRSRSLGMKRSLAVREFALGVEGLERFVRQEPLRRVHECAFAVLALESEPVDPRL